MEYLNEIYNSLYYYRFILCNGQYITDNTSIFDNRVIINIMKVSKVITKLLNVVETWCNLNKRVHNIYLKINYIYFVYIVINYIFLYILYMYILCIVFCIYILYL